MSTRHRNLRKVSVGDDDYEDDLSQSFDDKYSYAVSPGTSEMYMYNRNNQAQSISEFIKGNKILEEEDSNPTGTEQTQTSSDPIHKDSSSSSLNQQKLDEDFMFQMEPQLKKTETQKKAELNVKETNESQILTPKSQAKFSKGSTPSSQLKPASSTKQFPQINELKITASSSTDNLKKTLFLPDKEQLLKQYEEHTAGKDVINLVVIGHVDSGKSTLMGHLLFQMGQVSNKVMHKYKQESQKIGKGSFAYAWILDETEDERSRGITIDVAQTKFETDKKIIYLLDAPGHKDFIPNMIAGANQADSAILVINSITGEFETGFDLGGQTREHSLLAKSLGVSQLIIAINKMDMCEWSETRFNEICKKLGTFLTKQVGFKETDLSFIPCSGLLGENLTTRSTNPNLTSWYKESLKNESGSIQGGLSLLDSINKLKSQERPIDKPFRFCISDVFKSSQTSAVSISGKVEAGAAKLGDKIIVLPSNETGIIKSIYVNEDQSLQICFAGDSVTLNVANVDINNISIGNFICDTINPPMPVTDRIKARIIIFNLDLPLIKGFPIVFHYKSLNEAATIKKLVSQLDKSSGEIVKERPRFLNKGMSAVVEIKINKPVCVELFQNYRELGRFMLRYSGTTIAAGQITEIIQKS